ncbi:MAG: HAMP domain-containing sensor histidine kinase [Cyanobacteria bacterium J06623_7]
MLESSGSILQLSKTVLSNVNLLVISDSNVNLQQIANCLQAAEINFDCDVIDSTTIGDRPADKSYRAIVYDYLADNDAVIPRLLEKLHWCSHLHPDAPIILLADSLTDETAVTLIKSGVDSYLPRHKLAQLPLTIKKSLFDFASQQTVLKQQSNLIQQQKSQLQRQKAEIAAGQENIEDGQIEVIRQRQLIEQQQERIQQLEIEVKSWQDGEQTKQEHLAHLNHELRSPISSILGFSDMLKQQYYGDLNERQMRYVNAMLSVGQYMMDLVNNYLDLAKIDANKQTLDLEKIAVAEVCQNALFCLEQKAQEKQLELKLELARDIDFCTADSRYLRQILTNLLSNAVKFTDRGSITLQVKNHGDCLNFAVIDTGAGISSENLTKLFKPFPQISNRQDSTGLGLALSRKLARLHGGDIVVTSELGRGSCFTLSIPRDPLVKS